MTTAIWGTPATELPSVPAKLDYDKSKYWLERYANELAAH
jgi:hypothetical protein